MPKTDEEVVKELESMKEYLDTLIREGSTATRKARADGYIRALKWFLDIPLFGGD